jgi:hypothetical protein
MAVRVLRLLIVALGLTLTAAACGDDDSSSDPAPEDVRAPAAEVATGLKQIVTVTADLAKAAGSDKNRAKSLHEQIEPVWHGIEGTVKANDRDAYLAFEDSFALLKRAADDSDAAKATEAAGTVSKTAAAYLAKYPG